MESKTDCVIDIDHEFKTNRLAGWKEIGLSVVSPGDHLRVTSNRYKEMGRKCSHVVVQDIQNDEVFVNSYRGTMYDDWKLKPNCPYKQQKYYMRTDAKKHHDGKCVNCRTSKVDLPYWMCIYCKNKKRIENMRRDLMSKPQ